MASPTRWFYIADDRRQGPVELNRLVELILSGTLTGESLVWNSGRPDWIPACRIAEIARELPPPIPQAPGHPAAGALDLPPPVPVATAAPAEPDGPPSSAAEAPAPEGDGTQERHRGRRHHKHRHKHHHYLVIASPWWRRWLIPFLIALVGLAIGLWLYLTHVNQQSPPPQVYPDPMSQVVSRTPAIA